MPQPTTPPTVTPLTISELIEKLLKLSERASPHAPTNILDATFTPSSLGSVELEHIDADRLEQAEDLLRDASGELERDELAGDKSARAVITAINSFLGGE